MSIEELRTSGLGEGHPEIWHANELSAEERALQHGVAEMDLEADLTVGQHTTVTFTYQVGDQGVETGGRLGICWRWPYDWADLQADDPKGPGYVHVSVERESNEPSTTNAAFAIEYRRLGGIEPWHHQLALELTTGRLRKGDRIRIVCGERRHGGTGWRAPTCRLERCGFLALVDRAGSGTWIQLLGLPTFPIRPRDPVRLVAVADSEGVIGSPVRLMVRGEDEWGNTSDAASTLGRLEVRTSRGPAKAESRALPVVAPSHDEGVFAVHAFHATFPQQGTYTLTIASERLGQVESNPIVVRSDRPDLQVYWGDLHAGQTEMGCGAGTVGEHFRYGRDVAGVSFMSEQSNDHYVTAEDWQEIRRVSADMNEPGRFVAFLGCEWSPPTKDGGDRNVVYRADEPRLQRSGRYFQELQPDPEPDIPTAPEFHEAFRDKDVLVNIHVGGRRTNLDWYEPEIERLAEIHSTHGTIEWFIEDVLERGYRVGITAGTDGVMARPAADHPGWRLNRNLPNGLTGVLARDLTREALWEALSVRRTFATTGARMLVSVDVDGHPMGSEFESDANPLVTLDVTGTAAIERIDLIRGTETIHNWNVSGACPDQGDGTRHVRILWSGTSKKGTARFQRVDWDGSLRLEDGEIVGAQPIGFCSPTDSLRLEEPGLLHWTSVTAGSDAGVLLHVRPGRSSTLHFSSPVTTFSCHLDEVLDAAIVTDAGGFNRRVEVGPAPDPAGARGVRFTYRDVDVPPGWNPYWIRVIQVDRSRGWSSPVYVHRASSERESTS